VKPIIPFLILLSLTACKAERVKSADGSQTSAAAAPVMLVEQERKIVRNATMRIVVADTAKAVNDVTASIGALNGYVSGSEVWREGELLRARLTLRVPSKSLGAALAEIRKVARRVDNETMSSEDVTEQYVDLEARLRNLEATEIELRELLKTVRANSRKASEILEVHQQLVAIRGEIEQTRGRINHLGHTVTMSHVGLEILPDAITKPVVEEAWQPVVVVKDASRALVSAGRAFASAAIWIVIYVIPVCGTIALLMAGLWIAARRLPGRSESRPPAP
jgi:hypothetical protein